MQRVARLCARQEMERCRPGKTITKKCGCSEIAGRRAARRSVIIGIAAVHTKSSPSILRDGRLDEPYRSRYAL